MLRLFLQLHGNDDFSLLGELHDVIGVIDKDLPQPERIPHQVIGSVFSDAEDQFKALCCRLFGNQMGYVFQYFLQLELYMFNGQLTRFDLREIKNIVDNSQKMGSRLLDLTNIIPLLVIQIRLQG